MELNDLRKLSGLNECGMSPMGSPSPTPASISMTAASGPELSGMLKDIMSLAGMHKVEPGHLGVEPAPMKLTPEPVKAVGPAASDGEVMRGLADKLNLDKDDKEIKADEAWDNTPEDPRTPPEFDANEFSNNENPPGAGKGRRTMQPNAQVEDIAEQLFAEYQNFLAESEEDQVDEITESQAAQRIAKACWDVVGSSGGDNGYEHLDRLNHPIANLWKKYFSSNDSDTMDFAQWLDKKVPHTTLQKLVKMRHDLKPEVPLDSMQEEKSWFDMDSKERAEFVAGGRSKAHRSGSQPGASAAPAKTGKGDIKAQAADVRAHTSKSEYKGKADDIGEYEESISEEQIDLTDKQKQQLLSIAKKNKNIPGNARSTLVGGYIEMMVNSGIYSDSLSKKDAERLSNAGMLDWDNDSDDYEGLDQLGLHDANDLVKKRDGGPDLDVIKLENEIVAVVGNNTEEASLYIADVLGGTL